MIGDLKPDILILEEEWRGETRMRWKEPWCQFTQSTELYSVCQQANLDGLNWAVFTVRQIDPKLSEDSYFEIALL